MDDGSAEGDYRRAALVGLRPDPEHGGYDTFTRRPRDIYSGRLHSSRYWVTWCPDSLSWQVFAVIDRGSTKPYGSAPEPAKAVRPVPSLLSK